MFLTAQARALKLYILQQVLGSEILTAEVIRGFLQTIQVNTGIAPQLRHERCIQFAFYSIIHDHSFYFRCYTFF